MKFTEERKKKHSEMAKRLGFGKWMVGKKHTQQAKDKVSRANKGKKKPLGFRIGSKHSEETKKKLSLSKLGEKNPMWDGGTTKERKRIQNSKEYKLIRKACFERDNFTCLWCGIRSGNGKRIILNADHIKPFADYPELRFALDNLRTLCIDCHRKTDTYGTRIKQYRLRQLGADEK